MVGEKLLSSYSSFLPHFYIPLNWEELKKSCSTTTSSCGGCTPQWGILNLLGSVFCIMHNNNIFFIPCISFKANTKVLQVYSKPFIDDITTHYHYFAVNVPVWTEQQLRSRILLQRKATAMTFKLVFHRHKRWTTQLLFTWTEIHCIKISPWLSPKYISKPNQWISPRRWVWSFKKWILKQAQDVISICRQSPAFIEGIFPSCRVCLDLYGTTEVVYNCPLPEQSKTKS